MRMRSFSNQEVAALDSLSGGVSGADEVLVAVAYAKVSGVRPLLALNLPRSRLVIGTGFALTEPAAVHELHSGGHRVRLFLGDARATAEALTRSCTSLSGRAAFMCCSAPAI